MLEIEIRPGSPDDDREIDYSWTVAHFLPRELRIDLNFTNPYDISQVDKDLAFVRFWGYFLFASQANGVPIEANTVVELEIPRQSIETAAPAVSMQAVA